ncbi:pyruvate formate lyase family protein [Leptolyngbya sp. 7M]|uniref:pyruvate formate lyase family protein n=1 Tax=Leptolyngbya sp. 7M TaxID=2812896 RepID=UPI001B8D2C49|nr:SBBP repeat-containing protein [Leptolyngbya sp. 7M]
MPRDIAKSTLAAAKPLNLGTSLNAFKGVLGAANRDDLFRFRFDRSSSFNLDLATDKGGVIGVQVFSLKGAKKRVLQAIGRKAFSTLKRGDIKKFLQPIANQTFANGKDGMLNLDLPAGEFYLRIHQRRGSSSYGAKLAAKPLEASVPNNPGNPTPQPVTTPLNTFSRRWLQQFGTSGNDYTYGTAVDRSGNLYVAGVANAGSGPAGDGFIAKYAVDGTQLWRRSIDTPGADVAFDVAVDDAGNYYVTGATVTGSGSATNSDVFVTKYNSDGLQQWIKTIATTVDVSGTIRNGLDAGLSLALNGNNLYISGLVGAFPLPSLGKAFVAKYDATTGAVDSAFGGAGTGRVEFGVADATAAVDLAVSNGKQMQFFGARVNLAKCLLYAINGGKDEKSGEQIGPAYAPITAEYLDYAEVMQKFTSMMAWLAKAYINTLNVIHYMHDKYCYERLEMALHDRDVFRTMACGIAGLSVVADSLSAIKYANVKAIRNPAGLVVDYQIEGDFPKYGNNDDRVDQIAVDLVKQFMKQLRQHKTYRDAVPTQSVLTITSNVVYGKKTGNTPDGRKAGEPFAPGANPMHGRDSKGAIASLASVAKLPYAYAQDGISNTFSIVPGALGKTEADRLTNLVGMLDGYCHDGGHHLNVNVLNRDMLLDAMDHPELYPQLTIRVSGYAVNFIKLTREQQLDVIKRTFHDRF